MASPTEVRILDPSQVFRPEELIQQSGWTYRKYDEGKDDPKMKQVFNTYKLMHQNQTVDYVMNRRSYWCKFDKFKATIMEALVRLNEIIDESDPDSDLPNIVHAFQTAEMIRKEHPDLDWFHLTGLIHDLGKVMVLYGEPQWSTVGDTYPVGCEFAPSIVFRESSFAGNPDLDNKKFNTKYGMYSPKCGLQNVTMSWGHDEYMYQVLKHNETTLPQEGLYVIRYHSFYPWHSGKDYGHLINNEDQEMLQWITEFKKFDLYTKKEGIPDIEELKPYYQSLIDKYIPGTLNCDVRGCSPCGVTSCPHGCRSELSDAVDPCGCCPLCLSQNECLGKECAVAPVEGIVDTPGDANSIDNEFSAELRFNSDHHLHQIHQNDKIRKKNNFSLIKSLKVVLDPCRKCSSVVCPQEEDTAVCKHGTERDPKCGCCDVCLKGPGQTCGGRFMENGSCGKGLLCVDLESREIPRHRTPDLPTGLCKLLHPPHYTKKSKSRKTFEIIAAKLLAVFRNLISPECQDCSTKVRCLSPNELGCPDDYFVDQCSCCPVCRVGEIVRAISVT